MLSAAKHLQYFPEAKQMQILRFAHDDSPKELVPARWRIPGLQCMRHPSSRLSLVDFRISIFEFRFFYASC